ncbi:MAG: glycosyltransferase family 9 protein [Bryobacteraceae bacterium]|nr:glycosyltransferase family 9 protein [Bryobacteraceae bacterium]
MSPRRILVVRLGAMGDILHTLPAAASLRASFSGAAIAWICHPKWRDLIELNPAVDEPIYLDRRSPGSIWRAWRALRRQSFDLVTDFQGLTQSALVALLAKGGRRFGFDYSLVRETPAALFYHCHSKSEAAHVVDRNLDLAILAGATSRVKAAPLPPGRPEGSLPSGRFVLAAPLAGWVSKQWPLENYSVLARRLRHEAGALLVLNGAPSQEETLRQVEGAEVHISSIAGLIDATRRASAVLGLDSGPLHLAAALGRPGVALYGPTDPGRNGPYSARITVLRAQRAETSYGREPVIHPSMRELHPDAVFEALRVRLREDRE